MSFKIAWWNNFAIVVLKPKEFPGGMSLSFLGIIGYFED